MSLPLLPGLPLGMTFNPAQSHQLAVATSTNEVYVYDIENGRMTVWSEQNSHRLPDKFLNRQDNIKGLFYIGDRPNILVVWSTEYFFTLDLSQVALSIVCKMIERGYIFIHFYLASGKPMLF